MTDPLQDLPTRAQIGYVLKHATVHQGDLTPGFVLGILRHKGIEYDDPDAMLGLIDDVMTHNPNVAWGGGEANGS